MLDIPVLIETEYALLPLDDVQKYFYPFTLEFITYIRNDGSIYRAEESRRDLDIFYVFQSWDTAETFAKEKGINKEDIIPLTQNLNDVVVQCNRQTLVMIDPQCREGEPVFENFFVVRFESHRHSST